jgi:hypothetical protein
MVNGSERKLRLRPILVIGPPQMVIHTKGIHYIQLLKTQSFHGNRYKTMTSNGDFLISSKTQDCR